MPIKTIHREEDDELHRIAQMRWAELMRTGLSVGWSEARLYLQARAKGAQLPKPATRRPAR